MGTLKVEYLVNRAKNTLFDEDRTRWPDGELIDYLSDAQIEAVLLRPEINPFNEVVELVAGTKQTIPSDGFTLITVVRNMGANGTTPGPSIIEQPPSLNDHTLRDWHAHTAAAEAEWYRFDNRDRRNYYVYPPQPSADQGQVELVYSASPRPLFRYPVDDPSSDRFDIIINQTGLRHTTNFFAYSASNKEERRVLANAAQIAQTLSETIELDNLYQPALVNYMLYRAYQKDQEESGPTGRSATNYQMFANAVMGYREQAAQRIHPRQSEDRAQERL